MAAPEGKDAQPVLEDEIVPEPPPSTLPSEAPQVSWLKAAPQVPRLARALLVPRVQVDDAIFVRRRWVSSWIPWRNAIQTIGARTAGRRQALALLRAAFAVVFFACMLARRQALERALVRAADAVVCFA